MSWFMSKEEKSRRHVPECQAMEDKLVDEYGYDRDSAYGMVSIACSGWEYTKGNAKLKDWDSERFRIMQQHLYEANTIISGEQ
jgi:hypothetical protein